MPALDPQELPVILPFMIWKPHVTVAAVAERRGKFLLVEEHVSGGLRLNQPAGHLESGESLLAAVIRETREESAWSFQPETLVGVYLWQEPQGARTFLRFAFSGSLGEHHADQSLDEGIVRTVWLSRDEIASRNGQLRSPLVLRCVEDFLAGRRFELELIHDLLADGDGLELAARTLSAR